MESLGGLLFGNIDEHGDLDLDAEDGSFFDKEMRSALNKVSLINDVIEGAAKILKAPDAKLALDSVSSLEETKSSEAIDFSNIDEAAVDLSEISSTKLSPTAYISQPLDVNMKASSSANHGADLQASPFLPQKGGVLRYTSFFMNPPRKYNLKNLKIKRKKAGSRQVQYAPDESVLLKERVKFGTESQSLFRRIRSTVPPIFGEKLSNRQRKIIQSIVVAFSDSSKKKDSSFHQSKLVSSSLLVSREHVSVDKYKLKNVFEIPAKRRNGFFNFENMFDMVDWESSVIIEGDECDNRRFRIAPLYASVFKPPEKVNAAGQTRIGSLTASRSVGSVSSSNVEIQPPPVKSAAGRIVNMELLAGDWENEVIIDELSLAKVRPRIHLELNMNDPLLLLSPNFSNSNTIDDPSRKRGIKTKKPRYDKPMPLDRFNLSNEKYYAGGSSISASLSESTASSSRPGITSQSRRSNLVHSLPALRLTVPAFKTTIDKAHLRRWHRPLMIPPAEQISFCTLETQSIASSKGRSGLSAISSNRRLTLRDSGSTMVLIEHSDPSPFLFSNSGMCVQLLHSYRKLNMTDTPSIDVPFGAVNVLEITDESPFSVHCDVEPGKMIAGVHCNLYRSPIAIHSRSNSTDFLMIRTNIKGSSDRSWYIRKLPNQMALCGQIQPLIEVFNPNSRKFNTFCRARVQAYVYRLVKNSESGTFKINRVTSAFAQFSDASLRKWIKEYAERAPTTVSRENGVWHLRSDAPILNEDDLRLLVTPDACCQYEGMLSGQQRISDLAILTGVSDEQQLDNDETPWALVANFLAARAGKAQLIPNQDGTMSYRKVSTEIESSKYKEIVKNAWNKHLKFISNEFSADILSTGEKNDPNNLKTLMENSGESISEILMKNLKFSKSLNLTAESQVAERSKVSDLVSVKADEQVKNEGKRRLTIVRVVNGKETTEVISDDRVIGAYIQHRKIWERKRRRRASSASFGGALNRSKKSGPGGTIETTGTGSKKIKRPLSLRCGTCGAIGHMRTNRICPLFNLEETTKRPVENASGVGSTGLNSETGSIGGMTGVIKLKLKTPSFSTETGNKDDVIRKLKSTKFKISELNVDQQIAFQSLKDRLLEVHDTLASLPDAWPFLVPVSRTDYPHYYATVKRPLDLGRIRSSIKRGTYTSGADLLSEYEVVRDNCIQFNGSDHLFTINVVRMVEETAVRIKTDARLGDLERTFQALLSREAYKFNHEKLESSALESSSVSSPRLSLIKTIADPEESQTSTIEEILNVDA